MTENDNDECDLTCQQKKEWQIEGYKALMQYGIQMSQDHVMFDRIFMPVSLAPAYAIIASSDSSMIQVDHTGQIALCLAAILFLWMWHVRNRRSQARLNKVWETVGCIERDTKICGIHTVLDYLDPTTHKRIRCYLKYLVQQKKCLFWRKDKDLRYTIKDFGIKAIFFYLVTFGYFVLLAFLIVRLPCWCKLLLC